MKKYLTILFVAALIFSCGSEEKPANSSSSNKKELSATKAPDGKKIFKIRCVVCHGLYGDMEVNGAKNLNLSTLTHTERVEIITNGKNVMTPFKGVLSEEEIAAVAQYTIDAFKKEE